ncbi:MAG: DNA polymerase/3'-5' exonuclease PolX, partial [Desulfobacteraceae bacterium]
MPVHNADIADIFNRVADFLEIQGANPFRVRAYRNAARTVGGMSKSVADMAGNGKALSDLPGIGKDLAGKIREIVETGKLSQLEELEEALPSELHAVLKIPGLGAKKVKVLYDELNIGSVDDLKKAAEKKKIRELPGFGKKTEEHILEEVERKTGDEERLRIALAEPVSISLLDYLKKAKGIKEITVAGSFRRGQETVGDLDILVTCKKGKNEKIMYRFVDYEDVDQVVSHGETRSSVVLDSGLQVDLRVVPQVSYGAALHYFTGSKAHNIAVRKLGVKKGLKINEYGVFKDKKRVAGRTEKEIYKQVDLPYIEPELREDRGEIEAAGKNKLPELLALDDIRGDLHSHTKDTDGRFSAQEMAEAAKEKGYAYLGISNHSQRLTVTKGLDKKRLAKQIKEIDRLNEKMKGFIILKSIEVDILEDGSLDLPNSILKELDFVVCSVHSRFRLSREKQTERLIRAMDSPYCHILGHPTGRLINEREPYDLDMEKVMEAARERQCFMELNAQPERLDLNDVHCKIAKEMGVKVAISTDAHSIDDLDHMR